MVCLRSRAKPREFGGELAGFSSRDAAAQKKVAAKGLLKIMVVQGDDFDRHLLHGFRVSEILDEKKVALEAAGIGPAEQRRNNSGMEKHAFVQRPFLELGGRTVEPLAEEPSHLAGF